MEEKVDKKSVDKKCAPFMSDTYDGQQHEGRSFVDHAQLEKDRAAYNRGETVNGHNRDWCKPKDKKA